MNHQSLLFLALLWPLTGSALEAEAVSTCHGPPTRVVEAHPGNYRNLLGDLQPGDRLELAPGSYTRGLPLHGLRGAPGNCISIQGPEDATALFTARDCCNTVSLKDVAYLAIRNLTLDGGNRFVDGVKLEGNSSFGHHVVLENLRIINHGAHQQTVGISTKAPAWNWVIRHNTIIGAGTGMYLGDSDGGDEFVNGLIEFNQVADTIGYNLQIKHQNGRNTDLDDATMPDPGETVIRYNCFSKASGSGTDPTLFRPNVLVGHWPLSGSGADDQYLIYGNEFHHNDTGVEGLLQATGNVTVYDNLFDNPSGPALMVQTHEGGNPQRVQVFHNTVVASAEGIWLYEPDTSFEQRIVANAVFANPAISGNLDGLVVADNITDSYQNADDYLLAPYQPTTPDLHPLQDALEGPPLDLTPFAAYPRHDRDFDCRPRVGQFRGAYTGPEVGEGWQCGDGWPRPDPCAAIILLNGFENGASLQG